MKVIFEENEVRFDTLKAGDTFIDNNYDRERVLVVVEPSLDVDVSESSLVEEEYAGYAVDLSGGALFGFTAETLVIPVKTEVTVFRS